MTDSFPNQHRRIGPSVALLLVAIWAAPSFAGPSYLWSQGFGDVDAEQVNVVTTDASGNIIIAGTFSSPVSFGGPVLPDPGGPVNMFVAKYDAAGVHQWSKGFVGNPHGIAVNATGDIYITGAFRGVANFGGASFASTDGTDDIFLVKFDADGVHQWSTSFGNPAQEDVGRGIAVNGTGAVVITGSIGGATDFGEGPIGGAGSTDAYVARFDAGGMHQWSKGVGGAQKDIGRTVAVDDNDHVFLAGEFLDTVDFGAGPITNTSDTQVFLADYDANGAHVWSRTSTGGSPFQSCNVSAVALDGTGGAVVCGEFNGTTNFGGSDLVSGGQQDIYLARYDGNGNLIWSQRFGSTGNERPASIATSATGVFITGTFGTELNLGGDLFSSAGGLDVFLAKYDLAGNHQWSRSAGSVSSDLGSAVAVSVFGNVVVGGSFRGPIDFGGDGLANAGSYDAFLASYRDDTPNPVFIQSFYAVVQSAHIVLRWSLASDEPIKSLQLYRWETGGKPALITVGDPMVSSYVDASVAAGKTYAYQLVVTSGGGDTFRSAVVTTSVHAPLTRLEQNEPNPFNPRTSIPYTLDVSSRVVIEIFNPAGELVARLDQGRREPGSYHAEWDGRNATGGIVASGMYLYRIQGIELAGTRKMILLK